MKHVTWILLAWAFVPFLCNKNILSPCTNSVLDTRQAHRYAPPLHNFKADIWFFITTIAVLVSQEVIWKALNVILIVNAQDTEKQQEET